MKHNEKVILVSSSYHMDTCYEKVLSSKALEILSSEESLQYNKADRYDEYFVMLSKARIICPFCKHEHFLKNHRSIPIEELAIIKKWADPQISLFEESAKKQLTFFDAELRTYSCPHCGYRSSSKKDDACVVVSWCKNKVSVCCEVNDLSDTVFVQSLPKGSLSLEFPLFEKLEFNVKKGRIYICLTTIGGAIIHTLDITNNPQMLSSLLLDNLFKKFLSVKEAIVDAIQTISNAAIPFDMQELSLADLVFFTRFIGFDKSFYFSIPFEKKSLVIDRSFKDIKKLHTTASAARHLSSFSFAQCKSLKKIVCEVPGLLFYLPECESLFQIIGDVNVFRKALSSKYAFDILLILHQRPITINFFRDYCAIKGSAGLLKRICPKDSYQWNRLRYYILHYCSFSESYKRLEQNNWKEKRGYLNDNYTANHYSLPLRLLSPHESICIIDEFSFKPLHNTSECYRAGKELRNCLKAWESYDSAVVSISRANEIIAVIEINDNEISQVCVKEDEDIYVVFELSITIEKWARLNKVWFDTERCIGYYCS